MHLQGERNIPPQPTPEEALAQAIPQTAGQRPAPGASYASTPPPFPSTTPLPTASHVIEPAPTSLPLDEGLPGSFQDDHIRAILRAMSLGHLLLGIALLFGGIATELFLHEAAFYGLAASGGMLGICGLITLLAAQRERANQSPLAFYLLPYADFAIVGLWLLLFSMNGAVMLFYAYVIVSAALLLGSRHAITLAILAGATILAITLEQAQGNVMPAITLSPRSQVVFTSASTVLALGLLAYVARLFSINLDRFIALTNQQKEQTLRLRRQLADMQEQARETLEYLSNTYVRFLSGDLEARAPIPQPNSPLAFATHLLNTLLDQLARHSRAWGTRTNLEERIGDLVQALDRLNNGDAAALQPLSNPTGSALDPLVLALGRVGRQLLASQQSLKQTSGSSSTVQGLAADLALLHQALGNIDAGLRDLHKRAAQSAAHLHALVEEEEARLDLHAAERPVLREAELRAHQQSAGLELLRARLGHAGAQLQAIEKELRRIAEMMEQVTRVSRPLRAEQPPAPGEAKASGPQTRPASAPAPEAAQPATPTPTRPPSEAPRTADALPRRFNGPLLPPSHLPTEKPGAWQVPFGKSEQQANSPRH